MDTKLLSLHVVSNLISGFSFFGVSYFFLLFIVIGADDFKHNKFINLSDILILFKKKSYLVPNISAVFWFCGLGHVLEAFKPWMINTNIHIVAHWLTAFVGMLLVFNLWRIFHGTKIIDR